MSTAVIGDFHTKTHILELVENAIKRDPSIKRIVFLGDYVDEWGASGKEVLDSLDALIAWKDKMTKLGYLVTCLLGNHDKAYLDDLPCSGKNPNIVIDVAEKLKELNGGHYLSVATVVENNFLASHAGLTDSWYFDHFDFFNPEDLHDLCRLLNQRSADKMMYESGAHRGGFDSPGPLWADRRELIADSYKGINQIVGHSPVITVLIEQSRNNDIIVFCDTFSVTSAMNPIGNESIAVVDGKNVQIVYQDA